MNMTFKVIFETKNLKGSIYEKIPGLEKVMEHELFRVYNKFADICNSGITERLNEEYDSLFKNEGYANEKYNQFMAEGYQRLVVDELNNEKASPILNFYVDPLDVNLVGYLKEDRNITIEFYLKEA